MRAHLAASLLLLACNQGEAHESQLADLGPLELEVPMDWQLAEVPAVGALSKTWVPRDNVRKESIVVVRSEVDREYVAPDNTAFLEQSLKRAQARLPRARLRVPLPTRAHQGLDGVTITLDFVPPGQAKTYHRVHTVLRDEEALVHVIYTALDPDPDRVALDMALGTLRRKEG